MYLARGLQERLQRSLSSSALVILEGARATGKTRLIDFAIEQGWLQETRSFIDPSELNAARAAPRDYVFGLPHGTAIDEAQLCEDILLPVKERIERSPAGTLLLTGSTRLRRDGLAGSDPLAGRVGSPLQLGSLTIGERSGEPVHLVEQLFDARPESIEIGASIGRTDLVKLVQEPGLPGLLTDTSPGDRRDDRGRAYINQVTSLGSFASVDVQRVGQLARYLAGRTSTPVNINQFANDVELARQSVDKYLAHLAEALVVIRLPGWRRAKDKSETDRAKLHFFDAGIACLAARMRPAEHDHDLGRLVETLLVTDLVRQSSWSSDPPSCYHWRKKNNDEVDLVLEAADGRAVCVEVKTAESVAEKDFRGIDAFRDSHPDSFHRGFVFYSGDNVQPFGEDKWAIPFAALGPPKAEETVPTMSRTRLPARESKVDLWERVLPRLAAMTSAGSVEWDDEGEHAYTARTNSGSVTIGRKFAGLGMFDVRAAAISSRLERLTELLYEIDLTMYDSNGAVISTLLVAGGTDQYSSAAALGGFQLPDPAEEPRHELYKVASGLLLLIEHTPSEASSVADSILDELGSD